LHRGVDRLVQDFLGGRSKEWDILLDMLKQVQMNNDKDTVMWKLEKLGKYTINAELWLRVHSLLRPAANEIYDPSKETNKEDELIKRMN